MSGRARALMVQGAASHVGQTVLVAALCRYFRERQSTRLAEVVRAHLDTAALDRLVGRGGGVPA